MNFSERLVLKWKILSCFNSGFTSDPHSQQLDATWFCDWYVLLDLLRFLGEIVFEVAHIFTLGTDFQELEGYFILEWVTKNSRKLAQLATK